MPEIVVKNGKTYREKCGGNVYVMEMKGDVKTVQLPHVLVDGRGHVVVERATENEPWEKPT